MPASKYKRAKIRIKQIRRSKVMKCAILILAYIPVLLNLRELYILFWLVWLWIPRGLKFFRYGIPYVIRQSVGVLALSYEIFHLLK